MRHGNENRFSMDAHVFDIDQIGNGMGKGFGVSGGQLPHNCLMQLFGPFHHREKRPEFVEVVAVFCIKRPELPIGVD